MPRLNLDQRNQALGMLRAGVSQAAVSRQFNVSKSTISRLAERFRLTGSASDRPRPGQPRVTSVRQDNYIRQRHLRDRHLNAQSTANIVVGNRGVNISSRTVRNRLRERGIYCRRPYVGPILTRRHRILRQQWVNANAGRNWRNVVFSDESRFNLSGHDGRHRVYRRRNERYHDVCVVERDRFGGGSVMVWGSINHNFRSPLIIVNGNLTAQRYINEIVQPVVTPMLQRHPGMIFQHDNARPHVARQTVAYMQAQGIPTLDWPSRSPDLNPIEHMWDELGRRLRQRQNQPQNVRQLGIALQQEWNNIPRRCVRRLCNSMPNRIRAVIQAHGGHTRY